MISKKKRPTLIIAKLGLQVGPKKKLTEVDRCCSCQFKAWKETYTPRNGEHIVSLLDVPLFLCVLVCSRPFSKAHWTYTNQNQTHVERIALLNHSYCTDLEWGPLSTLLLWPWHSPLQRNPMNKIVTIRLVWLVRALLICGIQIWIRICSVAFLTAIDSYIFRMQIAKKVHFFLL